MSLEVALSCGVTGGQWTAAGKNEVVCVSSSHASLVSLSSGVHSYMWHLDDGFTPHVSAVEPKARMVALTSRHSADGPLVWCQSLIAADEDIPVPPQRIAGVTDLELTALAWSAEAQYIAATGGTPEHRLYMWQASSGARVASAPLDLPGAVTALSFRPGTHTGAALTLCASGPGGVRIVHLTPTHNIFDVSCVTPQLPADGAASDIASAPASATELLLMAGATASIIRSAAAVSAPGGGVDVSSELRVAHPPNASNHNCETVPVAVSSIATPPLLTAGLSHAHAVLAHAWLSDGSALVVATLDGALSWLHPDTGALLLRNTASAGGLVTCLATLPDGFAAGYSNGSVHVYTSSGDSVHVYTLAQGAHVPASLSLQPDEDVLLAAAPSTGALFALPAACARIQATLASTRTVVAHDAGAGAGGAHRSSSAHHHSRSSFTMRAPPAALPPDASPHSPSHDGGGGSSSPSASPSPLATHTLHTRSQMSGGAALRAAFDASPTSDIAAPLLTGCAAPIRTAMPLSCISVTGSAEAESIHADWLLCLEGDGALSVWSPLTAPLPRPAPPHMPPQQAGTHPHEAHKAAAQLMSSIARASGSRVRLAQRNLSCTQEGEEGEGGVARAGPVSLSAPPSPPHGSSSDGSDIARQLQLPSSVASEAHGSDAGAHFVSSSHAAADAAPAPAPVPARASAKEAHEDRRARVTAVAVHASLPLIAVGCADGGVTLLLAALPATHAPAARDALAHSQYSELAALADHAQLHIVWREVLHDGAVTSLLFSPHRDSSDGLLFSLSAHAASLVTCSLAACASQQQQQQAGSGGLCTAAVATAQLPSAASGRFLCMAACVDSVGSLSLFFGASTGHLLSLTLPTDLAQLVTTCTPPDAVQGGGGGGADARVAPPQPRQRLPLDFSAALRLRARLPSAIQALALTWAAPFRLSDVQSAAGVVLDDCRAHLRAVLQSGGHIIHADAAVVGPLGDGVLFAACAGESSILVLPYDGFHLAADALPACAQTYAAIPASTSAVLSALAGHHKPVTALALSPAAHTHAGAILASGGADGSACVWALGIDIAQSSSGGGEGEGEEADVAPPSYTVRVLGSVNLPAAGTPLAGIAFDTTGSRVLLTTAPAPLRSVCGGAGALPLCLTAAGHVLTAAVHAAAAATADAPPVSTHSARAVGEDTGGARRVWLAAASAAADAPPHASHASPLPARIASALEAADAPAHAAVRAGFAAEVDGFRASLRALLEANAAAAADERLQRTDFVIDAQALAENEAAYDAAVAACDAELRQRCDVLDGHIARVRAVVVDPIARPGAHLRGILLPDVHVDNFPQRRRTDAETRCMTRIAQLRRVEQLVMSGGGGAVGGVWPALAAFIPPNADWLLNCSGLPPSIDPAQAAEAAAAAKAAASSAPPAKPPAAAAGAAAAGTTAAAGSDAANEAADARAHADANGTGTDGVAAVGERGGADGGEGARGVEEAGELRWEGGAVLALLYHPAAVRTPAQKRTQIALFKELVRATQATFNERFEKLRVEKVDLLEGMCARNRRLRDIAADLGDRVLHLTASRVMLEPPRSVVGTRPKAEAPPKADAGAARALQYIAVRAPRLPPDVLALPEAAVLLANRDALLDKPTLGAMPVAASLQLLVDPVLHPHELPESVLHASADEIGVPPYVAEEELQRRAAEEERARRAAEANTDDAPERALQEMMGGTLEAKDELLTLQESLVREPWMDTLSELQMTNEQKSTLAAYNTRMGYFQEECAKRRNALAAESNRLVSELREMAAAFDDKLQALAKLRLTTAAALHAQELYIASLAMSLQTREYMGARDKDLEDAWMRLVPEEEAAAAAHEAFKLELDYQQLRVEEAMQADKVLERSFRDAMREACGGAIDNDVQKVLVSLFKKRAHAPSPAAQQASSSAVGTGTGMLTPSQSLHHASTHSGGGRRGRLGTVGGAGPGVGGEGVDDTLATLFPGPHASPAEVTRASLAREATARHLTRADCPDGYSSLADDVHMWTALNSLRHAKIQSEFEVAAATRVYDDMQEHLSFLARKYEVLKSRIDAIGGAREALASAREVALNDTTFLVKLKLGQDEAAVATTSGSGGAACPLPDYSDAMLIPVDVVETVNTDIRARGERKVGILTEIKDFRRNLLYMEWERAFLTATLADLREYYRDLQLMRAMGVVGEFIKGVNVASKARKEADKASERLAYMKVAHQRTMEKLDKAAKRMDAQVSAKRAEVDALRRQCVLLEENVALRENILRSRNALTQGGAGGMTSTSGGIGGGSDKMKVIAAKTKLNAIAKAQAEEIELLRSELDKLRQKNFAAFPTEASAKLGSTSRAGADSAATLAGDGAASSSMGGTGSRVPPPLFAASGRSMRG